MYLKCQLKTAWKYSCHLVEHGITVKEAAYEYCKHLTARLCCLWGLLSYLMHNLLSPESGHVSVLSHCCVVLSPWVSHRLPDVCSQLSGSRLGLDSSVLIAEIC